MSLNKRLSVDGRKIFASINGGFANENVRRWVGAFAERGEAEGRGGLRLAVGLRRQKCNFTPFFLKILDARLATRYDDRRFESRTPDVPFYFYSSRRVRRVVRRRKLRVCNVWKRSLK